MKNQSFPFFLAVHAVFSRYGQFLKQTVDPAFQELRQEFLRNGISVHIQGSDDSQTACRELIVESGSLRNFIYGIRYRANDVSDTVVGSLSFPTITEEKIMNPFVILPTAGADTASNTCRKMN